MISDCYTLQESAIRIYKSSKKTVRYELNYLSKKKIKYNHKIKARTLA